MTKHQHALDFILNIAQEVRTVSLSGYDTMHTGEAKPDKSLVTAIDRAVEQEIRKRALDHGWGIVGEEFGREKEDAEYVIVTDPIDGTNHYITHDDCFYTLIGVHHKTDGFVAGVCDQPATRHMWAGVLGGGAFYHHKDDQGKIANSRKISTAPVDLSDAILTGYNPMRLHPPYKKLYETLMTECKVDVPGGDAGNYARLAEGRVHLVLDNVGGLHDVAALIPIIHESGGVLKKIVNGVASDIKLSETGNKIPVMAASCPILFENAMKLYTPASAAIKSAAQSCN